MRISTALRTGALLCLLAGLATAPVAGQAGALLEKLTGQTKPQAAEAAPGTQPEAPSAEPPPQELPGPFEVVPRAVTLVDDAATAEERIDQLTDLGTLEPSLKDAAEEIDQLESSLDAAQREPYSRVDRITRIQQQINAESGNLEQLVGALSKRFQELDALHQTWTAKRDFWLRWRRKLEGEPGFSAVKGELDGSLSRIDHVLSRANQVFPHLVELQGEAQQLEERQRELADRAVRVAAARRHRLLRRGAPVLLSPSYFEGFGSGLLDAARRGLTEAARFDSSFFDARAWLLALHLLGAILLGTLARRLRSLAHRDPGWQAVLAHPWAVGVFVSTAVTAVFYVPAPALWDLCLRVLLGISGCLLAAGLFGDRRRRGAVYGLALFYPVFSALEVVAFPRPLFRLFLFAVAATGLVLLLGLARAEERAAGRRTNGFGLLLRLATVVLGTVLLAQILGYDALSHWLVDSASASGFVIFVVVFLLRLGRGAIHALLVLPAAGRLRLLRRVGYGLSLRLSRLLEVALVVFAGLYILTLWGVFPSAWKGWTTLVVQGFTLGGSRITVGQLVVGFLAVYLAFVASWLVQSAFEREVLERRELDRGVGDSVRTLLHYTIITVGVLAGLSLAGFELRSFAIVAGALGVGVGFGLQNVVNNFISGLILLFERPVRVGDVVVLEGEWGTIKKIGLRSTVVLTFDQSEIIVPNSDLISEKVTNWTLTSKMARIVLPVGVAYGSDLPKVFETLQGAAASHPLVLGDPAPQCLFVGFGDSSLDFELRLWVREIEQRLGVRSEVLGEIDRRFREAGIEIPFPQRDLHLRSVDEEAGTGLRGSGSAVPPAAGQGGGPPRGAGGS